MKILEINHCRKRFGENEVLSDISLSVEEGQVVSVIGPSGSGKSTLLRCATLLETMDGGSLAYGNDFAATMDAEGKSVYADKAALRRIKSRFGLVFQQFNLFPHYTVLKNVTDAPLIVQKRERGEVRELALSAGVNPNTMQRAMTELEREGLVFPQRTAGRFVTEDAELIAQARREIARVKAEAFLEAMRSLGYTSGEILGLMGSLVKEENGNGQL